jgi:hypothetical protein
VTVQEAFHWDTSLLTRSNYPVFPLCLDPYRARRSRRFGRPSPYRVVAHDSLGVHLLAHLIWDFADHDARLALLRAIPALRAYLLLRRDAFLHRSTIAAALQQPRGPPALIPPLCHFRSWFLGAALLSFDFRYWALVRWLGGEYTNEGRDWSHTEQRFREAVITPPLPRYPTLYPELAMRSLREGVPIRGTFLSRRRDMIWRYCYDNHPPLREALEAVRSKFATEEALSFHLVFPKFIGLFLPGLMISPISWLFKKNKGRLIIDASSPLGPVDTGAPNSHIPLTGAPDREEENPPVFYGNALKRHLTAIWNMRISYPDEELLQHMDDIDSAFRRVLYHPVLAPVFAYVFQEFLIVPVGNIFGSKSAPSWFTILAELRAHMANVLPYEAHLSDPLVQSLVLPPQREPAAAPPVPAVADRAHRGATSLYPIPRGMPTHHAMFVDDNALVALRRSIRYAVASSLGSSYDCFGSPAVNLRRGSVISKLKFDPAVAVTVLFVGFLINTQSMTVTWPPDKRDSARQLLDEWLHHRTARAPRELAQLLGIIRHGAFLSVAGNFLSVRLQWILSACVSASRVRGSGGTRERRWWSGNRVRIPPEIFADLRLLRESLEEPGAAVLWSRPIGLLVDRTPTVTLLSDASYGGIGGWSDNLRFLWRVTRNELISCGFPMRLIDSEGEALTLRPSPADDNGLHINLLEFIAIIINVWLALSWVHSSPAQPGGHIIAILADNTSALSWLRYAARSHRRPIQNLAHLCQCLLYSSQTSHPSSILGYHIPGSSNDEADALSRPEKFPTLGCAIAAFYRLQTCRIFQLPFGVLSLIARVVSSTEIGVGLDRETTALFHLAPSSSDPGFIAMDSTFRGYYKTRSHRGKG